KWRPQSQHLVAHQHPQTPPAKPKDRFEWRNRVSRHTRHGEDSGIVRTGLRSHHEQDWQVSRRPLRLALAYPGSDERADARRPILHRNRAAKSAPLGLALI